LVAQVRHFKYGEIQLYLDTFKNKHLKI